MRRRLDRWWHRHIRRHHLGPQVHLATIPSPWPDFPEFPVCEVWATRCGEDGCFWVSIETGPVDRRVSA